MEIDTTRSARSTSSNAESPFLRLPGEIRNMIYEYHFTPGTFIIRRSRGRERRNPIQNRLHPNSNRPLGIPLLLVYRQIHRETALLPYKFHSFHLDCFRGFSHKVRMFSEEQLAVIKKLHLQINWGDSRGESARIERFMDDMHKLKIKFAALLPGIKCIKLDIKPKLRPSNG
ncbi:hypothetical protein BKA63DRAFT_468319 [Paraphoma chrysanthemicola]|nr:hypothetical protein BKA63DRAFT_468319 [Paraphoma chrysanthemicola]